MLTLMTHSCVCDDTPTAVEKLEHCVTDTNQWKSANRLRLNPEKTELLWSGSKHSLFVVLYE